MFYGVSSLISISNKSSFDTSNITNMSYMFYNCSSLNDLSYISNWNTSKVIDMSYMFYNCSSLKVLDNIYYWNTKNVKIKEKMLYGSKENIYFYHIKYIFYNLSLFLLVILFFYDLNDKKYFLYYYFEFLSFIHSLMDFTAMIMQIISPYYFLYLSFHKYELEKYLDKTPNYNYFMKINNNNNFLEDKIYLKHINIFASIIYTPFLIILVKREISRSFINPKFFKFLIKLFLIYSILQIFNFRLFIRLNNSFKIFENNLNKDIDINNRLNFGDFNLEMNMIKINILFIIQIFATLFLNNDNNKNIKNKINIKNYCKNNELFELLTT